MNFLELQSLTLVTWISMTSNCKEASYMYLPIDPPPSLAFKFESDYLEQR